MKKVLYCICLCVCMQLQTIAQRITLPNGTIPFFSGINVAWRNYGGDCADTPINVADWTKVLDDVKAAGGNTVRWWLFVNASQVPKFTNGYVSGLGTHTIINVQAVLDLALERNMMVIPCLLSFDMLQTSQWGVDEANNKRMLQTDAGIKACIDNAIVPLVTAIGNHPSLLCWEIFNEPEGMTEFGWTPARVAMTDIQKFVNRAAGAIHTAVPGVKVSNGSWNMKVLCNILGHKNYYSDTELRNAGGVQNGILDFYMVHYYNNDGGDNTHHSPFHHNAAYWGLNKPIIVAEYSAHGFTNPNVSATECYKRVYEGNYAGALSWTYTNHDGHGGLADATPGLTYLENAYPNDINIDLDNSNEEDKRLNVALHKMVTVSSTEAGNNIANNITDGDKTTRWASVYADQQWVQIDLEYVFIISEISLFWEAAYGKAYKVEISENGVEWLQIFDTTTGNGGIDKITFTHRAARYVRITCTSRATEWGYSLFEVEVYQSNLALNRPVAVSSTEAGFGNIASNINDSLKTTRWSSSYTNAQWLTIDLQQIYTIDRMQILWEAAYGSQYTIAISTDSIIWNIIYTESAGNGDEDTVSVSDNPARYVRWQGIQRATDFGYSIFEFEVYGKKHVALQPVTQTIALQKGWNLISVSVVDSVGGANAINRIFMGMDVNIVKNADGFWKPNQPEQLNSLQYIEPGKGYLVYMNAAENLTISGIPCRGELLFAPTGWQLIGYPCTDVGELLFVPTPISNYFNTTNCNMIKNFDGFWVPNGAINSIENFESGKGYFLKK
ncbi:MAG: F5/8 type C domain protein [Bacteroidetes bacterium ADurb.Bin217]|nr:MAG: F5/8 type C domain protein [Bacteroidetes bacterium ADurb.Bin217]